MTQDPLELELKAFVSHLTWVLEKKRRFSGGSASSLDFRVSSLAPSFLFNHGGGSLCTCVQVSEEDRRWVLEEVLNCPLWVLQE